MKPARRTAATSRTALPRNVELSLLILEQSWAIANGANMTGGKFPDKVLDLFARLNREGIDWVLAGAQAVNLYLRRARATVDVEIIVRKKDLRKAKKVLRDTCGAVKESEVHFRAFLAPKPTELGVDVIKSTSHDLFEVALDGKEIVDGVPAPPIEALLALKFLSAVSPWRSRTDKHQDMVDFMRAFFDNRPRIDRALLTRLAAKAYKGARPEFEKFLHAVENDLPITI